MLFSMNQCVSTPPPLHIFLCPVDSPGWSWFSMATGGHCVLMRINRSMYRNKNRKSQPLTRTSVESKAYMYTDQFFCVSAASFVDVEKYGHPLGPAQPITGRLVRWHRAALQLLLLLLPPAVVGSDGGISEGPGHQPLSAHWRYLVLSRSLLFMIN